MPDAFDARDGGTAGRLTKALEMLGLVKAVATGPAPDGPAYRARPTVDTERWHHAGG